MKWMLFLMTFFFIFCVTEQDDLISSILYFICGFFFFSMYIFILGNSFLALIYMLIYVGAVSILMLFIVMLMDFREFSVNTKPKRIVIRTLVTFLFLFGVLIYQGYCLGKFDNFSYFEGDFLYTCWYNLSFILHDVKVIGQLLYNYLYPELLVLALFLVICLIGSVTLIWIVTKIKKKNDSEINDQITRNNRKSFMYKKKK